MMQSLSFHKRQQGVTLLITLIMLVMLTLFALTMAGTSIVNLRIVGNQQFHTEARTAAQLGIEYMISKNFPAAMPTSDTIVAVDINGDGTADYNATVAVPTCLNAQAIKLASLDITNPNDNACFTSGASQNSGTLPAATGGGDSLCANTRWDIRSSVADTALSKATVAIHQGVGVRAAANTVCP